MAAGPYQKCEKTHLSNAREDTLQLRFSKMGLSSAPAPDAIVADQMEVEI
jgi:hypothetical protein